VRADDSSTLTATRNLDATPTKLKADLASASNEASRQKVVLASEHSLHNREVDVEMICISPELLAKSEALRSWGYKVGDPLKQWVDLILRLCECFETPGGKWIVEHESRVVLNHCGYDCPDIFPWKARIMDDIIILSYHTTKLFPLEHQAHS
jgi:hypothetical protein